MTKHDFGTPDVNVNEDGDVECVVCHDSWCYATEILEALNEPCPGAGDGRKR